MSDEKLRDRVIELLDYDAETGVVTWKVSRGRTAKAGSVAGTKNTEGYICVKIDGKEYRAHRLAFLVVYGYLPKFIDHINNIKDDNRIGNLREATSQQNKLNCGKLSTNTSGIKGVCFHKQTGKWCAQAKLSGERYHLGLHPTAEEAGEAYKAFCKQHHGNFLHIETS